MNMRYVDANETNNVKLENGDEYVHMVTYMLVKYIHYMHVGLARSIMRYLFGNRVGRRNATQITESSLWGRSADAMKLGCGCGHPGPRARQGR